MSSKNANLPPLPGDGGRARREAAAAALAERRRAERRRRVLLQVAIGVVVVLVAVGATVLALSRGGSDTPTAGGSGSGSSAAPAQVDDQGAFVMGTTKPKVTIEVVEDFQCPICRQFEETSGSLLDGYIGGGEVQVRYRTIAFLDRMSSTQYSTRALNASACVMPAGQQVWKSFHDALFANQPPEQGDGLPDSELVSLAQQAGAPASVASCISDQTYAGWTAATTQAAFDDGITGTPTLFVNGQKLPSFDPDTIKQAVESALAR